MTFLIDPPLLIAFSLISCWIGERVSKRTQRPVGKILIIFSLSVIIFTSTTLYLNMWFMDWFWLLFSSVAISGRDLMINSGIFSFESVNTGGLIDAIAFLQILLYPLWSYIGLRLWNHYHSKRS